MVKLEELCLNCMSERHGKAVCPHCGWQAGLLPQAAVYLRPGTILHDKYCVGGVLGHGGFGITYLGWDVNLETRIAIKEYLPRDLATRAQNRNTVVPYSGEAGSAFEYGLEKFVEEARALARLADHPGIVTVRDYFRENGTAYLVMVYLRGSTLKDYLKQKGGKLPFETALKIMMAVMDTVREIHGSGIIHRDISPDNIYITSAGQIKILDFGAARYAVGEYSKSLSIILKAGYAPEEQYRSRGNQGPWTDVYAVGATLYHVITGVIPPESLDRMAEDTLKPPSKLGAALPSQCEAALIKALALRTPNRFQSIKEFQEALASGALQPVRKPESAPAPPVHEPKGSDPVTPQATPPQAKPAGAEASKKKRVWDDASVGIMIFALPLIILFFFWLMPESMKPQTGPITTAQPAAGGHKTEQSGASGPKAGEIWREPLTGMEFVWVPGGCYQMGCGPWTSDCMDYEKPAHEVCVDGFWMGKREVTRGQFSRFADSAKYKTEAQKDGFSYRWNGKEFEKKDGLNLRNPGFEQTDEHPVVDVSWNDARAMADWLSRQGKGKFRLPSEAEWEYACRSAGKAEMYAGGSDVEKAAWYLENSGGSTHVVGTKVANGLGLHDMSGNVWEWCEDTFSTKAYSKHQNKNPIYTDKDFIGGSDRVLRGGGWDNWPDHVRCAWRNCSGHANRSNEMGFRLLRMP